MCIFVENLSMKNLYLLTFLFVFGLLSYGQLPITEAFNYPVGSDLGTQGGWTNLNSGDAVTVLSGNLSYTGLEASTGNKVGFSGTGFDPQLLFGATENSGTVYASFIIRVTDLSTLTNTNGGYFAGFGLNSNTFAATVWLRSAGTQFNIGINKVTSTTDVSWLAQNFNTNEDIFVVIAYTFGSGNSDIWVNPADTSLGQNSAPAPDATATLGTTRTSLERFFLRQDSATETPGMEVDELRIAKDWASVTPTFTLSLEDKTLQKDRFTVFPNPASSGYVNISSTSSLQKDIEVYDVLGKRVLSQSITGNRLELNALRSGVYILKITQDNRTETKKLVIR